MDLTSQKLLVVGAGGIGCELLKNLILTGFSQIEVIDLDTIELSNLNRQFLFQKCHVGKPKAIIARESVLKYNPHANIIAYHDSIMNQKYNVEYFKQFNIVLNALDNKAARSHVNRLCLAADVPLIESGSAGYLGQVTLIKKSLTECYDCLPKPPQKTFPGCTIRNTPSEPIHCIVWAKHLFNQLFGAEDPDEAVSPDGEDPENMANAGQNAVEKNEVVRVSTRQWAKETKYNPMKLFNKLFNDDVKYLLSMAKLWEKRKAPTPLDWSECVENETVPVKQDNQDNADKMASLKIWTISECCKIFEDSINKLYKRLSDGGDNEILCWDKDDEDAMNFVASAANLRCIVFSIIVKSKFEIKSLAGNIIPAIATTNAIVAGLIVLEALKVLDNKINECKTVYLRDKPISNKLVVPGELVKPNPKCYVCAAKPEISVRINLNTFTVKQFETKILKQELNMVQPDVEIDDGTGRIIISSEEGETEENNDKPLGIFGLGDQSRLKCDDFFQNYELNVVLYHSESLDNSKEYEIISDTQTIKDIQTNVEKENLKLKQAEEEQKAKPMEEDVVFESITAGEEKKRSYEAAFRDDDTQKTEEESSSSKKLKPAEDQEDISSHSVNNASEVLSDEEEAKNSNDVILEEDDIIIEDDSNKQQVEQTDSNDIFYNHKKLRNGNFNGKGNSQDDDVIECSSEEEIIEINDDESQSRQTEVSDSYHNGTSNGTSNGASNGSSSNGSDVNGDGGSNDAITLE